MVLIGLALGLASAMVWALTGLAVRHISSSLNAVSFNAFRMSVAGVFFVLLLPFFGGVDAILQVGFDSLLALAASTVLGVIIGDTMYFWSLAQIGAARAMPISGIYPVFTWLIAVPMLNEPITPQAIVGTLLVLGSLFLLAPKQQEGTTGIPRHLLLGTIAALVASLFWAFSTTLMKIGMSGDAHVIVINAFRMPLAAICLLIAVQFKQGQNAWNGYQRGNIIQLILLALFSSGLGGILWTLTVQYVGAARAALLVTSAPLIGVPLSAMVLHEHVTRRTILGTILSVMGVWLVL